MKKVQTILKNWIETDKAGFIRTFLLSEGFGFCLCASFFLGYHLDKYGTASHYLLQIILLGLLFGTVAAPSLCICHACFGAFSGKGGNTRADKQGDTGTKSARQEKVSVKIWLVYAGIIFACWCIIWLADYS